MASFTTFVEKPVFSSLYEGLVISIHALMKERGYEAFCENDTIPKNSMGMYSNFNEKAPETWSLHYKHPEKTNEVFVTCAMWGEKMLVVLDELAFGTPPNHFGPPMRHSIRRTQFGIQADKYKPVEESAEPESESVEDKIQSLRNSSPMHLIVIYIYSCAMLLMVWIVHFLRFEY
mmetsp:Transcript_22638/g.27708  ORF Transcript_22638/g.27708 Transcript_22638/m.27708 type:complete len:175 (-) Transcript_22638:1177-1701(-)